MYVPCVLTFDYVYLYFPHEFVYCTLIVHNHENSGVEGGKHLQLFDFSKAFDSVNHDILLMKLKHEYAINGTLLKFLVDSLQNRQQCVVIGGHQSEHMPVASERNYSLG